MYDMYDFDEEFFEPGEFDEKIEELKEELRNSVKTEIKDEVERLRKENAELREVKKNFNAIKEDYESKKRECERAIAEAETKAKRERLSKLIDPLRCTLYGVGHDYRYKKKCDECDEQRTVKITLPSGKKVYDSCKCNKREIYCYPREYELIEFRGRKDGGISTWYIEKDNYDDEDFYYRKEYNPVVVDHNTPFEELESLKECFLFTTKEECQEFCDYLNKKNGSLQYKYLLNGELANDV